MKKILLAILLIYCFGFCLGSEPDFEWMKDVGSSVFPVGQKLYNVGEYGAVGDARQLNTKSIQQAIDECEANGGGIVSFDPGVYLTGALFIGNNVNLVIPKGTSLIGSQNISDYPIIDTRVAGIEMKWPAALINVIAKKNVAISGDGTIDCRGNIFWDQYWKMRKDYESRGLRWVVDYDCQRPRGLLISQSTDITLRDFVLLRPGFWSVHVLYSEHVTVEKLIIANNIGGKGPSTDGIDIDSSRKILIQDCIVDCNDDNFCLKAGRDADGLRINKPCEYIVIKNCESKKGDGLITIGSETSGGIRNVIVSGMRAKGTYYGIRFKSTLQRGGVIENIYFSDIKMDNVKVPFIVDLNWFPAYNKNSLPPGHNLVGIPDYWLKLLEPVDISKGIPKFRDIHIQDLTAKRSKVCIEVRGLNNSSLDDFSLKNVFLEGEKAGFIEHTYNWTMQNTFFKQKAGAGVSFTNNKNLSINDN